MLYRNPHTVYRPVDKAGRITNYPHLVEGAVSLEQKVNTAIFKKWGRKISVLSKINFRNSTHSYPLLSTGYVLVRPDRAET